MTRLIDIKLKTKTSPIIARAFAAIVWLLMLFTSPTAMSKTLNIATIKVAPFGFFTEDKKPTGMMYEISNLIAEEAGLPYINRILPYARTSYKVASGEFDFVLRYSNEQLSQEAIQVVSVVTMNNIVVGLAGVEYDSLKDLHGKVVANVRGAIFDKQFSADSKILKDETHDYNQGLKMLFTHRVDGIIGSNVGIYYTAHKMNYLPAQLGKPLFLSSQDFYLHFSKKNADEKIITALRDATIRLKKKGSIQKIIDRYIGTFDLSL